MKGGGDPRARVLLIYSACCNVVGTHGAAKCVEPVHAILSSAGGATLSPWRPSNAAAIDAPMASAARRIGSASQMSVTLGGRRLRVAEQLANNGEAQATAPAPILANE